MVDLCVSWCGSSAWLAAALCFAACKPATPGPVPRAPVIDAARVGASLEFVAEGSGSAAPAYALTASDGTGLKLAFVEVRAVVQGPLALTQLRLGFDNPEGRTIEGRFAVTMPEGAAISRFAMKIGEVWQEGEVVERLAASQVYESYLHRRVDPALLEHDAGDRFRARVFPIAAGERKELIVGYSQELGDPAAPYRLPLQGLPRLDRLDVRVFVDGEVMALERADVVPGGDLLVRSLVRGTMGVRHESLALARVEVPAVEGEAIARATGWTVLVDTSASQAVGFAARLRRLRPWMTALGDVPIEVVAFDQERVRVYAGPASGFGDRVIDGLVARGALGASDMAGALREARRGARVLVVSDGIATVGATGGLGAAAAEMRAGGVARIDAIVVGSASDRSALRAIGPGGVIVGGEEAPGVIARKLAAPVLGEVSVEVPGSRWAWPRRVVGAQPGDSLLVYAELDERAPLVVRIAGREQAVATKAVARPLIERAWRGAQLRELVAQHDLLVEADPRRAALRGQIVDTSVASRVLGPFTAMLVLETEADYQRFMLDRRALADIMVVGDSGLEVLQRDLRGVLARAGAATRGLAGSSGTAVDPSGTSAPREPGAVDSDGDGIVDAEDRCPMLPEDLDGVEDEDGCPDMLLLDNCQIRLSDKLYFEPRSAKVTPGMHAALADVVDTLNAAPDIRLWVDGHADSKERGPDRLSQVLSRQRVDAVVAYLIAAGIDPFRLEPRGMGESVPIADNKTAQGRAANRRVEFNLTSCQRGLGIGGWIASRKSGEPALEGEFLTIDQTLRRDPRAALPLARAWWSEQPGDVLAALALGRSLAAVGLGAQAARAYGSLIDLSPSRVEARRHAGQRLEAVGAFELAIDTYRQAAALRPDHPSSHRLLAFALARVGRHAEAFAALEAGLARNYSVERFPGVQRLLSEDLTIVGAAWIRGEPAAAPEVTRRLAKLGSKVADAPSLRFVLTWETDAADVDLHVLDANGRHPYARMNSGWFGRINVTEGYGPEALVLAGAERAYPYTVNVHYASQRAMGHAMGAVQVLEHDGRGRLGFVTLPFVLMRERGNLDIGVVEGPLIRD